MPTKDADHTSFIYYLRVKMNSLSFARTQSGTTEYPKRIHKEAETLAGPAPAVGCEAVLDGMQTGGH